MIQNNVSAKDQLAKLMATEDITVQHSHSAKTASFDVKYRVLTLPNWECSSAVHDLLVGHEVGHALWTKEKDWEHALTKNLHKGITNIVEDARIERKIKAKYPGLVKVMVKGYRELERKSFFYNEPTDIDRMNLIDRINLHCKLGPLAAIPFADIELPYLEMTENTNSWKSVEECVRSIMDFMLSEEYQEQQKQRMEEVEAGGSPIDGDEDDFDWEEVTDWDDSDGDNEEEGGETPHSSFEEDSSDKAGEISVETQDQFDSRVASELSSDENHNYEIHYFTPPVPTKEVLVGHKEAHTELVKIFADQHRAREAYWKSNTHLHHREEAYRDAWDLGPEGFMKFRRDAQKIVGYMAKEFERKKSASEYRKESISKTGVLDMTKVHQYKYNEDLFLRNTIRPDGKSHGLIMLFDWSASMTQHFHDTMKQTLALAWFCQKVNVPFEVYAFTNSWGEKGDFSDSKYVWEPAGRDQAYFESDSGRDDFKLVNILSSRMNSKTMLDQSKLLYILTDKYSAGRNFGDWGRYELSSTPICETLCAMQTVIPAFKNKQKLDIVNMIIMTDGEGNGRWHRIKIGGEGQNDNINFYGAGRFSDYRMTDPITKKVYSYKDIIEEMPGERYYENAIQETMMLKMLKDRHDINVIGLFLDGHSNGKSLRGRTLEKYLGYKRWNLAKHQAVRADVRNTGVGSVFYPGHDEYYLVPVGSIHETENNLEIESDWTAGKIKNAFKKNLNQKFGNKILVNKMMDIIA